MRVTTNGYLNDFKNGSSIEDIISNKGNLCFNAVLDFLTEAGEIDSELNDALLKYCCSFTLPKEKFLLIADTHMGGDFEEYGYISEAYATALKEDAKFAVHLGDLVEGDINPRAKSKSLDVQFRRINDAYPKSGINTYYIEGNHDYLMRQVGDLGVTHKHVTRADLIYLGGLWRYINIGEDRFFLYHTDTYKFNNPKFDVVASLYGHSHYFEYKDDILHVHTLSKDWKNPRTEFGFVIVEPIEEGYLCHKYTYDGNNYKPIEAPDKPKILTYK